MALLSEQDRQTVTRHLSGLTHDVSLVLFTQTIDAPETAAMARQILEEVASLSERVTLREVNFVLEKEQAAAHGIHGVPAVVLLRDGQDTRIRFLGAPAGYEFMSLIEAVILAGTDDTGLSADSRALIAEHATEPIDIKVFVTPGCPHCPRAVTLAHKMAAESANITATCVEATEFIDLSRQFRVTGVPKTIVNGTREILGAVPEGTFVRTALGLETAE